MAYFLNLSVAMLSFKHEVFLEVARHLSFTKASEALYVSQPSISKHIKRLEEIYNISLFERSGHTIKLTQGGRILLDYLLKAKFLQKQLDFNITAFRDQAKARGFLKLGASTTVSLYIIPPILSDFYREHKKIQINLVNRNSENILQALLKREIDLGIVELKSRRPDVKYQHFLTDEVVLVCSANSQLSQYVSITLDQLREIPLALRENGSGTLLAVERALLNYQIKITDLQVNIRLGGTEALKNFLLNGHFAGFLPRRSVSRELHQGSLVEIPVPNLAIVRAFYFIQRQETEGDLLNNLFIKFASQHYENKL